MYNNEGCFVENSENSDTKQVDDCLGAFYNNEDDNIKLTNYNISLPGTTNDSDKHNKVSNDNNIEDNPSYNNKGCLAKYDCINAHGIDHISETNLDKSTEANSHNEQKTIKIRTNNRNNEWWFCSNYNYIDPIIECNNMNNNNNNKSRS